MKVTMVLEVEVAVEPDKDGFYEAKLTSGSQGREVRALSRDPQAAVAYLLQEIAKDLLSKN